MKTQPIDNTVDLTGNCIVLNDNWYYLLKVSEPTHLPNFKPLARLTVTGTADVPPTRKIKKSNKIKK